MAALMWRLPCLRGQADVTAGKFHWQSKRAERLGGRIMDVVSGSVDIGDDDLTGSVPIIEIELNK